MATKTKEKTQAGEFLRSVLTTRGVTARTAAENLGVPVEHLYRVINSHQRLSDGLIVRLGAAFPEIPVSDWEMRRIADREAAIRRGIRAYCQGRYGGQPGTYYTIWEEKTVEYWNAKSH